MRNARSIRKRGYKHRIAIVDLDITSLLDVIVILLVFLLKSYNSSGVTINVPPGITLPKSESSNLNTTGVSVQVSPTTIWVDDKVIYDINKSANISIYDQDKRRIIPLYNELMKKKNMVNRLEKASPQAQKFTGVVNLMIDRTIKYNYIKKLLHTSAQAGYLKYKFVVMGAIQD
ncbi:MAG: hypothetical protein A2X86_18140 [Bdellovibrionales bacterium GWA2_49_15]|nr:MAG: hypothetical protein A2X86_18140 [Bdellovibrionales bacterium GWA2_49_15]HAZ11645.1 hypothetical protein [Bdellovibrionales bacterium]